jgi:anti-sigma factor RsiW
VSGAPTSHLTDEELLLDYYGEATAAERARVEVHLEECEDCRSLDAELRAVLSAVETTPITEPPGDFEREMWERIEPLLPVRAGGRTWSWMMPRLAAAAAVVLLVVAAYNAGRESNQETASEPPIERNDSLERLVRAEVGDHFERSQRVLVELAHADLATTPITGERARAADLVAAGRLYRRSVERIDDVVAVGLLEDIERVLVEVANGPAEAGPDDMARLQQRIADQDLLFRLRVVNSARSESGW